MASRMVVQSSASSPLIEIDTPPPSRQTSRPALGFTARLPTRARTASATASRLIRPAATACASAAHGRFVAEAGQLVGGRFGHAALIDHRLEVLGQRQQGFRPRDRRAAEAEFPGQHLRIAALERLELGQRPGQLQRPQIVAARILDDAVGQQIGFLRLALDDDAGHRRQPGKPGRPPAAFAGGDEPAPALIVADDPQRLEDAACRDRGGQSFDLIGNEGFAGLRRVGHQLLDGDAENLDRHGHRSVAARAAACPEFAAIFDRRANANRENGPAEKCDTGWEPRIRETVSHNPAAAGGADRIRAAERETSRTGRET